MAGACSAVDEGTDAAMIEVMGAETLMWGSNFPHPDGEWPDSQSYIDKQFGHLPAELTRKITCENAAKCYRPSN